MSEGAPGLRERKKLATRQAIGAAAIRLAIERGLENVLVEDIAAAADVSPRTFNNYFSSKYEAICSLALDRSFRIGEALRRRPAGESLWEAVRGAVLDVYEQGPSAGTAPAADDIARVRLVTSSPELRGEYLKALSIMQYELAEAIGDRVGAPGPVPSGLAAPAAGERPGCPLAGAFFIRGLAGAVTSALQAATERWLFADPPVPLVPVLEAALRELADGMHEVLPRGVSVPRPAGRAENPALPAVASG
jgi:AcrR family transcriptional regulator